MSHVSFPRFAPHAAGPGLGPLTNEQLRRLAPSAFASGKHESRSARYTYIPTAAVIDGLRANGFASTFAKQGGSRIPGKTAFTKHLIRFRLAGQARAAHRTGGVFPEVVLGPRRMGQPDGEAPTRDKDDSIVLHGPRCLDWCRNAVLLL